MKRLLAWLTSLVVVAVVIVVASYLVAIAAALIRANRNLAALGGGLRAIRDNTAPLAQDLGAINSAALTLRDRLATVDEHLRGIIPLLRAGTHA